MKQVFQIIFLLNTSCKVSTGLILLLTIVDWERLGLHQE